MINIISTFIIPRKSVSKDAQDILWRAVSRSAFAFNVRIDVSWTMQLLLAWVADKSKNYQPPFFSEKFMSMCVFYDT